MKLQVLLVEDSPMNSELACDLLALDGHEVQLAPNGAALRSLLSAGATPDIVLMDILLPDADGIALLAELRAHVPLAGVPVVALTAHALTGDAERMLAAGFNAVITKPIDTRTFVADLERWAAKNSRPNGVS